MCTDTALSPLHHLQSVEVQDDHNMKVMNYTHKWHCSLWLSHWYVSRPLYSLFAMSQQCKALDLEVMNYASSSICPQSTTKFETLPSQNLNTTVASSRWALVAFCPCMYLYNCKQNAWSQLSDSNEQPCLHPWMYSCQCKQNAVALNILTWVQA